MNAENPEFLLVLCTYPNAAASAADPRSDHSMVPSIAEFCSQIIAVKLAACINQVENVTSTFFWNHKLDIATETLLLIKTTTALYDKLTALILQLHPYECPEIIAVPIVGGNKTYLDWVRDSVK
jgi:uncharacterized protein involved in tolerance to divalent cations